jgi:iron complex outermembrane receptor protein
VHSAGGSRNERDIFIRGFDRQRVPLYLDGVRIFLPADNRIDFNRFLTPDLAEIQFQKGYVSVLNGPGGLGGAINLVSRKPTKEIELEGRSGVTFNGNADDVNAWNAYAYAGTKSDTYYAQVSGTFLDQDHWNLSNDFQPVLVSRDDGGNRDHSDIEDWRINVKAGFTPNATDEYSINYTTQSGEKSAPLHIAGQAVPPQRYWTWPYWDLASLSWLSKTAVGEQSYLKTNVYYNTFENLLQSFASDYRTQTENNQFNSYYDDYAYGGFVEMGTTLIPMNTLKGAIHYRRDSHSERSDIGLDRLPPRRPVLEPWQESLVDTWSFAVENTFHATSQIDVVTGVSYDIDDVKQAEDFNSTSLTLFDNELVSKDAWNGQGAIIYTYSATGQLHADVSSRTRFPTLFDRYSTRFDTRTANPDLDPERSTNYEIGWKETLFPGFNGTATVFYSDLEDSIQNVQVGAAGGSSILGLNVDGEHYGLELTAEWTITPVLRFGGNYTYLERDLDFASAASSTPGLTAQQRAAIAAATLEGTPRHEGFIYLAWDVTSALTLTPSLELASDRSSLVTGPGSTLISPVPPAQRRPNYAQTGSYSLLNLQAEYVVDQNLTASVGATNLLDQNYALAEGFPEPGRQFFVNLKARF